MADFTTVAKVGDIPDGQGIAYAVNGRMVAVFNQGGAYEAIDDFCPHMGASLAGGFVEARAARRLRRRREPQQERADLDAIAFLQRGATLERRAVQVGAVRAAEILDPMCRWAG